MINLNGTDLLPVLIQTLDLWLGQKFLYKVSNNWSLNICCLLQSQIGFFSPFGWLMKLRPLFAIETNLFLPKLTTFFLQKKNQNC